MTQKGLEGFFEKYLSKESLFLRNEITRIGPDVVLKQEVEIDAELTEVNIPMTVEFFCPSAGT